MTHTITTRQNEILSLIKSFIIETGQAPTLTEMERALGCLLYTSSGGQKQRLAIARAFIKEAPIIVLDEATSNLDSISEREIQQAFWELSADKTTIVIAHRLSTIEKVDRILVFDKGQIVEEGNHRDLIHHEHGIYRYLWELQSSGAIS